MSDIEDKIGNILNSPEKMSQILQLAKTFSASEKPQTTPGGTPNAESTAPDIDPKLLQTFGKLLGELSSDSGGSSALLAAVKPYLKADRREKVDRAVKLAKLAKVARKALGEFGGDGLV